MKGQMRAFPDIWKAKDQVIHYLMGKTPNIFFLAKFLMCVGDSGAICVYVGCRLVTRVYIQKYLFKGSTRASG